MLPAVLIAHLTLRGCIICADLTILLLLYRQHHVRQNLISGPYRSTPGRISCYGNLAIIILKLGLDVTVLIIVLLLLRNLHVTVTKASMTVAEKLSLAGVRFNLVINILGRFSMTCATALEVNV